MTKAVCERLSLLLVLRPRNRGDTDRLGIARGWGCRATHSPEAAKTGGYQGQQVVASGRSTVRRRVPVPVSKPLLVHRSALRSCTRGLAATNASHVTVEVQGTVAQERVLNVNARQAICCNAQTVLRVSLTRPYADTPRQPGPWRSISSRGQYCVWLRELLIAWVFVAASEATAQRVRSRYEASVCDVRGVCSARCWYELRLPFELASGAVAPGLQWTWTLHTPPCSELSLLSSSAV